MSKIKLVFILVLVPFLVQAQQAVTLGWRNTDLSVYNSFKVDQFMVNGEAIDYKNSKRQTMLVNELEKAMNHYGLIPSDTSFLSFHFQLAVDTLPIGLQRPNGVLPEDILTDFTLSVVDNQSKEVLFVGNVYGVLSEDHKLQKNIKKVYKRFFKAADF